MPKKQRYAVTQTVFIWAESRNQAARMVRLLQLQPKERPAYTDFSVADIIDTPDGSREDSLRYGICIFDEDV
jgi:hypothetical protein